MLPGAHESVPFDSDARRYLRHHAAALGSGPPFVWPASGIDTCRRLRWSTACIGLRMATVVFLLIVTALILLGAAAGRPLGWVAIGLSVLALLLELGVGGHFAR